MKELDKLASWLSDQIKQQENESATSMMLSIEPDSQVSNLLWQAEVQAALSGRFAPEGLLMSFTSTIERQQTLSQLVDNCIVETVDGRVQWLLTQNRRLAVLQRLKNSGQLESSLGQPLPPTDKFGHMLRKLLRQGQALSLDNCSSDDLMAISAATEAIAPLGLSLPDTHELRRQLNKNTLLSNYDSLLTNLFVGRQAELSALAIFVKEGSSLSRYLFWDGMILTGSGGAGKSTLLAKFAQTVVSEQNATIVLLDFDRPGIDPADLNWLEIDITRQVGIQYPELYEQLRQARAATRQQRTQSVAYGVPDESPESMIKARSFRSIIDETGTLLREIGADQRPFLLILDTYEEVVQRDMTGSVFEWLAELGDALRLPALRVIFSGRLFDTQLESIMQRGIISQLRVDELDKQQAEHLLRQLGVTDSMAKRLTRSGLFPLRPLELRLLAKVATRESDTSINELEQELRRGGPASQDMFAGLVYQRVLQRIKDPAISALAYPGLVLRYVTADLIRQVLVPALNLPELTISAAAATLDKLAAYEWLVERRITGNVQAVWHRRDLRRSMLRLMMTNEEARARCVSEEAVRVLGKGTEEQRCEAIYHQLLWMNSPEMGNQFDLADLKRAHQYIGNDIGDLPKPAAVLLRFAAQGRVQATEVSNLPSVYLAKAYYRTGRRLMRSREFGKALELLRRGQQEGIAFSSAPQTDRWEIETLFATACWDELLTVLRQMPAPSANSSLPDFVQWLYPMALISPDSEPAQSVVKQLSQATKADKLPLGKLIDPDVNKLLTSLSTGLVRWHAVTSLSAANRRALASIVRTARKQAFKSARLQRKLTLLSFLSQQSIIKTFSLAPSTLRLNLNWMNDLLQTARAASLKPEALAVVEEARDVLSTLPTGRQRTVRGVLRTMDALYKDRPQWEQVQFPFSHFPSLESLIHLFRGPDSEFRDPARFALLDAYTTPADHRQLATLISTTTGMDLDDLTPDAFANALTADAEHALESYIELVDRTWQLGNLLEQAHAERPDAAKLRSVLDAYRRWNNAVTALIASHFQSIQSI
ncbi:ATP-binding protein [Spirosoma montaniterrae]|nr:ATP-binding protein [Spirosoma montaniterrae]